MISSMRRHSQLTVEMRAEADMELEQRRDSLMTEQDATRVSRRSRVLRTIMAMINIQCTPFVVAFMQNSSAAQRVERSACGSHQLFIIRKRR